LPSLIEGPLAGLLNLAENEIRCGPPYWRCGKSDSPQCPCADDDLAADDPLLGEKDTSRIVLRDPQLRGFNGARDTIHEDLERIRFAEGASSEWFCFPETAGQRSSQTIWTSVHKRPIERQISMMLNSDTIVSEVPRRTRTNAPKEPA
jgi:hypothetical protein